MHRSGPPQYQRFLVAVAAMGCGMLTWSSSHAHQPSSNTTWVPICVGGSSCTFVEVLAGEAYPDGAECRSAVACRSRLCLPDADGDRYGSASGQPLSSYEVGTCAPGTAAGLVDCDDGDSTINPDAAEICNQVDDDCDGRVDESTAGPTSVCVAPTQDSDNDGIPDDVENFYGLDPNRNDAHEDADGDGVDNYTEYMRKLNPATRTVEGSTAPVRSRSYQYDAQGRLETVTTPQSRVDYVYDAANNRDSVTTTP